MKLAAGTTARFGLHAQMLGHRARAHAEQQHVARRLRGAARGADAPAARHSSSPAGSAQSKAVGGHGSGSAPMTSRQTPRSSPRQSAPAPRTRGLMAVGRADPAARATHDPAARGHDRRLPPSSSRAGRVRDRPVIAGNIGKPWKFSRLLNLKRQVSNACRSPPQAAAVPGHLRAQRVPELDHPRRLSSLSRLISPDSPSPRRSASAAVPCGTSPSAKSSASKRNTRRRPRPTSAATSVGITRRIAGRSRNPHRPAPRRRASDRRAPAAG